MKSYVYETVKLSNRGRIVTRYTLEEHILHNILKLLFFLCILWPFQLCFWWPMKIIFKYTLVIAELALRGIWWLIKLPFCLIFSKRVPRF